MVPLAGTYGALCPEIVLKLINVNFLIIFSISKNLRKFCLPKIQLPTEPS